MVILIVWIIHPEYSGFIPQIIDFIRSFVVNTPKHSLGVPPLLYKNL